MVRPVRSREVAPPADTLAEWCLRTVTGRLSLTLIRGQGWQPEPWQQETLTWRDGFFADEKSRRIGWSFINAAREFALSQNHPHHHAILLSYNLREATEKIHYVNQLWDSLPISWRLKKTRDAQEEVAFTNGSRILSWPSKPGRGLGGRVVMDELAHWPRDRMVYEGATASTVREATRSIIAGSTPFGKRGVFYELCQDPKYRHYRRRQLPWWVSAALCTDPKRAIKEAGRLPTAERVARFGTEALKEQFEILPLEVFQQEFECAWLDVNLAFIDRETILACTNPEREWHETWEATLAARKGRLVAGFDVGRRRHHSELIVLDVLGEAMTAVYAVSLGATPFHEQRELLEGLLGHGLDRLRIDATGMGEQLAEELTDAYPSQVEAVHFTPAIKETMATDVKKAMEAKFLELPADRDLQDHIYAIRRIATPSGHLKYDTDANERHHADKFWALALAVGDVRAAASTQVNLW